VNMLDIQGHTNRELVIVCSYTLTNYVTEEEGVVKRNKLKHFDLFIIYDQHQFIFDWKYIRNYFRIF
jgi:hypothetical protein